MRSYPDPENAVRDINAEGAIVEADADGAEATNPLEVQRRMLWVGLEQLEAPVRESADLCR